MADPDPGYKTFAAVNTVDARMESAPIDFYKELDPSILKDRTALVTGGASGIGLTIATALAGAGARVPLVDINEDNGTKAASTLQTQNLKAEFIQTDVTSWESQAAAFAHAASASPSNTVDNVVTAAGVRTQFAFLPPPTSGSAPQKPPTACLDVNLMGTYYTTTLACHYFTLSPPHPAEQLLFISSMAGYNQSKSNILSADYASSKFGVRGLFHQFRRPELGPERVGGSEI